VVKCYSARAPERLMWHYRSGAYSVYTPVRERACCRSRAAAASRSPCARGEEKWEVRASESESGRRECAVEGGGM
jgi:hypothetical protein